MGRGEYDDATGTGVAANAALGCACQLGYEATGFCLHLLLGPLSASLFNCRAFKRGDDASEFSIPFRATVAHDRRTRWRNVMPSTMRSVTAATL